MNYPRVILRLALYATATLSISSCGDASNTTDAGDGSDAAGRSDAAPADPAPIFERALAAVAVTETSWADGSPASFVTASVIRNRVQTHTELLRSGNCRLLVHEATFCEPACDITQLCSVDGCVPWQTYESAGAIELVGLTVAVSVGWDDSYYQATPSDLPTDLFTDTAQISATAAGDQFSAFTVQATGVTAIDPMLMGATGNQLVLVDGADQVVQWTADDPSARVRLTLKSANAAHGLPLPAIIQCDGPDVGSVTIPQAMIELFPEHSGANSCTGHDCPASTIVRYRYGTTSTDDGDVQLIVGSERQFHLIHHNQQRTTN